MKKIALTVLLFITLQLSQACTPRPDDDLPIGDSSTTELPPPANDTAKLSRQPDSTRVNYILPMDTVYVRDSSTYKLIHVGGPLGDGCQKFEYIDSAKENTTLKLTFWASRPKDPNTICTQQMQYVEREIRVPRSGYTELSVVQPDGKPALSRPL
jgi:hypothetical protein